MYNPKDSFPKEWTTFQGKKVSSDTIDHQHLSNCYWYLRVIHGLRPDSWMMVGIKKKLAERFNGQLLPYRPHVDFEYEINELNKRGLLFKVGPNKTAIVIDGEVIGEIVRPE